MDTSVHPPRVSHLHYVFEGWLGDELVESFPCWMVTESLAPKICDAKCSGVDFGDTEVSLSETFREVYPGRVVPGFRWLKVEGVAKQDDFGVGADGRLVVSKPVLDLLRSMNPRDLTFELAE